MGLRRVSLSWWLLLWALGVVVAVLAIPPMWSQEWVAWTRNAYPMAEKGVWKGGWALAAFASYYFIEFYGRTIATALIISYCFSMTLYGVYKTFASRSIS